MVRESTPVSNTPIVVFWHGMFQDDGTQTQKIQQIHTKNNRIVVLFSNIHISNTIFEHVKCTTHGQNGNLDVF